ncbi:unnamed protein product [Heligmosomoides polygyrus]|uniref:Endo/exonuclease/phosphatase domain-containing protein n=1 Tax=Heligmosomoides polygyrus TaxID=6339 RepID=A0A183GIQ6_HELPZ|nr:unnamed protein product [Heligmosomoides polygyrus]
MTIYTYKASTLASVSSIKDLMKKDRKNKYDVIGLTEPRRQHPYTPPTTPEKNRFSKHATERSRRRWCPRQHALGHEHRFVVCDKLNPMSATEFENLYVELERFYKEDHTFYKVIVGDFNAKITSSPTAERPSTIIGPIQHFCLWEDAVMDYIDEEYDRFVHHLRSSAMRAESLKTTKRRLSVEALKLMRQRGAARASGNYHLTSELAKLCTAAKKEDLRKRRAKELAKAVETGLSIRNARRNFPNFNTKMTALRRLDGAVTSFRSTMEKVKRNNGMFKFNMRDFLEVVVPSLHSLLTIHQKMTVLVVNAKELLDVFRLARASFGESASLSLEPVACIRVSVFSAARKSEQFPVAPGGGTNIAT